jgi:hypothetical protein
MTRGDHPLLRVPPDPDLSRLPVTFAIGPTPLFGLALVIAGIAGPFVVGGILGLIGLFAVGLPDSWGWIVLGFACIPLLAIPWGWWVLRTQTTVEISNEKVTYRRDTPLRSTRWQAPRSEYVAVAYRKVLPPSSSKAGVTMHGVELWNGRDRKRDVRLVQATDEALARETLARLAVLTGLPTKEGKPVRG